MREILFKARRLDNGEWVEGYYVFFKDTILKDILHVIFWGNHFQEWHEIDPETLCQYTGLTDKNGVKIFEGDVIKIHNTNRQGLPAPVFYKQQDCAFVIHRSGYNPIPMDDYWAEKDFEVIGNIHDKEE